MTPSPENELEDGPADLGGLFDRLIEISLTALEALQDEDLEQFDRCMADRQMLLEHHSSTPSEMIASDLPADRPRLLDMARRLEDIDARLALAVTSRRDEITLQIEAVDNGGAARSAYSGGTQGRGLIDIVR